jgi:predicted nucleic acid-binding protein
MRRVFLDTNILIDILLKRQPNFEESTKLLRSANDYIFTVSSISVTNAYYIAKVKDQKGYRNLV